MVYSMTGFGRGKAESSQYTVIVEMKSVNHRFCEMVIRMPRPLLQMEDKIKKLIQTYIKRGRIEVFVSISGENITKKKVQMDWQLLQEYMQNLQKAKDEYNLKDDIRVHDLLKMPDVLTIFEEEEEHSPIYDLVLQAAEQAVVQLVEMRRAEGEQLVQDVLGHLEQIKRAHEQIVLLAPQVVEQYRHRLQKRLADLIGGTVDEQRVLTEAAIFADKADINEELTRIESHLSQFTHTIKEEEAMGRKLDFLVQELNREMNTIGAKANNGEIAQFVVEMKTAVERIKEQVQNIE
jgi:uncharacterized protein (TIGR00255 family)